MEAEKYCQKLRRTAKGKQKQQLFICQSKSAFFASSLIASVRRIFRPLSNVLFFVFLLFSLPIPFSQQDFSLPMLLTVGLLGQKGVPAEQLLTMANQHLQELNLTSQDVYQISVKSFDMPSMDCLDDVGIGLGTSQSMDLVFGSNISAFFGPICSDDLLLTDRITSSLDIFQCNFWRESWANRVSDNLLDLSTMAPENLATNVLALLQLANWRKVALVTCPQCFNPTDQTQDLADTVGQMLSNKGIKLVGIVRLELTNGTLNTTKVMERMGPVKDEARILLAILGNSLSDYVPFLRALFALGMRTSEFVPIVCISDYSPSPLALPWLSNGTLDSAMLNLFHGTILLVNEFYPISQLVSFGTQIGIEISANGENMAQMESLLMLSVQLYECFWAYALLLWRTFQKTGTAQGNRNGTLLRANIHTAPTQGPFGPISVDAQLNRVAPFSAYLVQSNATDQPRPGLLQFANISLSCSSGTNSNCQTLSATALLQRVVLQFPPDTPICGFKSELCDKRGIIIAAVAVMVAICMGFIIFLCIRKVKRGETTQMPYYVPEQMIAFVDMDYGGSSNISIHSFHQHLAKREKEEERTDEFPEEIYSRKIATIEQSFVIVESFRLREKLSFNKRDTQLLFMMKQAVHDNINAFIGLCVERPTDVWVIWRHCFRGTLADLLFVNGQHKSIESRVNDIRASVASIASAHQQQRGAGGDGAVPRRDILDNNFKSAFVRDIVKGLDFLHSSPIGYHGALTSTRCLIDSHWILKLAGFGTSRLLYKWRHNGILSNGNGTVIQPLIPNEELHYYAPELRLTIRSAVVRNKPEEMEFTNEEGQSHDMYAFGAILYEILYRRRINDVTETGDGAGPLEPMEDDVGIFSAQAEERLPIVPEFPGEETVAPGANTPRSVVSSIDRVHPDLVALMRRCFGTPEQRPDANMARKITDATLKMSGSLVDQMIKNMEQYTGNLENLVKEQTGKLELEQQKIEQILLELLPKSVVDELRMGRRVEPQFYASVTIMYSDIVGFTSLCSESQPMEVVELLNGMFRYFDQAISEHKAYKVETIGDAYMVASGIPERLDSHVREIAAISLMQREFLFDYEIPHRPGQHLHCRWGFNSGSESTPFFFNPNKHFVLGVVGITAPRYCVFGSTVTLAAKMENSGQQDRIQMALKSYQLLSEQFPEFRCIPRGGVRIEGVGTLLTYWLEGIDSGGMISDRSASDDPTQRSDQ
ncbi:hypothetical protein niasHS_013572 [Heterodera schachtii]|uniref:guanylate cyclase n=1 Tax=Heterodera schachtii TaxID=97005 RepID=A0ABD2IFM7_HETSC